MCVLCVCVVSNSSERKLLHVKNFGHNHKTVIDHNHSQAFHHKVVRVTVGLLTVL